jgi:hypothetical protein
MFIEPVNRQFVSGKKDFARTSNGIGSWPKVKIRKNEAGRQMVD